MEIIPGILEKEWPEIEGKIIQVKSFATTVQIDFIDGIFSPNKTFLDPTPFIKFKDEVLLEAHLMTNDPIKFIEVLAKAGFSKFIGQVEKMANIEEFVRTAKRYGKAGLSLDIETPAETITKNLEMLDEVLVMTVKAGYSGQEFNKEALGKITKIKNVRNDIVIGVDGGINDKTILDAARRGATSFVSSSYLFQNPQQNYFQLQNLVSSGI